jgi:hypothetical protein
LQKVSTPDLQRLSCMPHHLTSIYEADNADLRFDDWNTFANDCFVLVFILVLLFCFVLF